MLAGVLHQGITNPPPSEKQLKKDLKQVQTLVVKLQARLMSLSEHAKASLGDLVDLAEARPDNELVSDIALPRAPRNTFTEAVATEEGMSEISEPEWELDDPVGDLRQCYGFQERLELRLAEQKSSGRPQSVKRLVLLLFCDLIHEYKGSCSESDLITLAEAYLRPILALHEDDADLSEHIKSVVKEVHGIQENGVTS